MNRGSINSAIKKGISGSLIANRQASNSSEQSRRRREEFVQKKRGVCVIEARERIESGKLTSVRTNECGY